MVLDELLSSRRRYLRAVLGTGVAAGGAGCTETSSDSSPSGTDAVVFTDSTTTTRRTDTASTVTESSTAGPDETSTVAGTTTPTATDTSEPEKTVFDGGDVDSFAAAVREADRAGVPLQIDPGTYRFDVAVDSPSRPKRPHLQFEGLSGVTIEGNGATIVFTNPADGGLWFRLGSDVTIRNLTLDFDPVPYTQGEIVDLSQAEETITLALDDGYPSLTDDMFANANTVYATTHTADGGFVAEKRSLQSHDKHFTAMDEVGDGEFRLHLDESQSDFTGITPGNRLTIVARDNESALRFYQTTNPSVENVTIRTANGSAFVFGACETPTVEDSVVAPPPDSNRQLATIADGIRITNCGGGSLIENCRHEELGDDSVAIDNHMATVSGFQSPDTITVDGVHPFLVKSGDTLEAMSPDGIVRDELPDVASYVPRFRPSGERGKPTSITFDAPVEDALETGDYLGNVALDSDGYTIRNNEFRNHRARLIRANTGDGVIEDNLLAGVDGSAIYFDAGTRGFWPPKGRVSDVVVRNNEIRGAGMKYIGGREASAILVAHETPPDVSTVGRPNRNVDIVDNEIVDCASGGIKAEAMDGLRIEGNTMRGLNQLEYREQWYGVSVSDSADVTVTGNEITGSDTLRSGIGVAQDVESFTASDNTLTVDGEQHSGDIVRLTPLVLDFSRSVVPDNANRSLAFCCFSIALVDSDGSVLRRVSIGTDEAGVSFGSGVDSVEQGSGDPFRWFGTENDAARLYFRGAEVDAASHLELEGYAIESGISASVNVNGTITDTIEWPDRDLDTYRLSLTESQASR